MAIRLVCTSPFTIALFRSSARSSAWILPSSEPPTTTFLAATFPRTFALGPMVKLFPDIWMLPSTWPSTYTSSLPESSPLMVMDLPMLAKPPLPGAVLITSPLVGVYRNIDCKSSGRPLGFGRQYSAKLRDKPVDWQCHGYNNRPADVL